MCPYSIAPSTPKLPIASTSRLLSRNFRRDTRSHVQEELDAPIVGNERRATRLDVSIKGAMTTRVSLTAWKDKTLHEWILFSIFPQTTISDTTSAANVPAWAEEMFIVAEQGHAFH